jgi:hypothetical protein
MAGLVPAIHVELYALCDVDARDKPGHDGAEVTSEVPSEIGWSRRVRSARLSA